MSVVRAGNQERAAIPALAFLCHNIGGRARFAVRRRRRYPIRSSFRGARKREPGISLPGLCAHIISRFRVRFAPRNDVRAQTKTRPAFAGLVHCCARPGYRKTRLSQIAAKALDAFAGVLEIGSLRSEEHTSELQSPCNLVCRLLLEKKKKQLTVDLAQLGGLQYPQKRDQGPDYTPPHLAHSAHVYPRDSGVSTRFSCTRSRRHLVLF